MKKIRKLAYLPFLCLFLVLAACSNSATTLPNASNNTQGSSTPAPPAGASNEKPAPQGQLEMKGPINLTMLMATAGGTWQAHATAFSEAIKKGLPPGSTVTVVPGQDGANAVQVSQGKADIALNMGPSVQLALKGEEPFKEKLENLRALYTFQTGAFQMVVKDTVPYDTLDEVIANKYPLKFSVNTPNSLHDLTMRKVLAEFGVTYNDFKSWGGEAHQLSFGPSFELLDNRKLEGVFSIGFYPIPAYIEKAQHHKFKLLGIKDPKVTDAVAKAYGFEPHTIKAGVYDFLDKDLYMPPVFETVIVSSSMKDEVAYTIVKAIEAELGSIRQVTKSMADLDLKKMANVGQLPLHPGAEAFYKEKGITK